MTDMNRSFRLIIGCVVHNLHRTTDALESCVSDGSADVKPRQTGETKFPAVTSQLAAYNFEATMSSFESNHCFGAVAPLKLHGTYLLTRQRTGSTAKSKQSIACRFG